MMKKFLAFAALLLALQLVLAGCSPGEAPQEELPETETESSGLYRTETPPEGSAPGDEASGAGDSQPEPTPYLDYAVEIARQYRDGTFPYDDPVYEPMPEDFLMPDLDTAEILVLKEEGGFRATLDSEDGAYVMTIHIRERMAVEGADEQEEIDGVAAVTFQEK